MLLAFCSCGGTDSNTNGNEESLVPSMAEGPYEVVRVVDGDTFIAKIDGSDVRVRVLCIDTPESVTPDYVGKKNTKEGSVASDRTKELLGGGKVYLEYDEEKYDQYDRVLAYVYLEDGRRLEDILISEGLCKVVYFEPNGKYQDELNALQAEAKKNKVGFWGTTWKK